ncbi:MAG: DNA (cytosine-5-)-methyltransferase [Candidatus Bathyarchaeota archaeon]|nr:DNA (cytosine-5-)-methyltransferase [Candidatus Bathyarchaeota archaeon]
MEMIRHIPPGGNWRNIPAGVAAKSKRLQQIRRTGGRTTYYGRLVWKKPSYTINTYFNRPGNGCFIHPDQNRLISLREGARLQSFPDSFRFYANRGSQYKQIGNAVPPLLARAIASGLKGRNFIDLFSGAGGLSEGFRMVGFDCLLAVDIDPKMCETQRRNHVARRVLEGDMSKEETLKDIFKIVEGELGGKTPDAVIGGPPCQGFSTAGWWDQDDPRNNLSKPFLQVVEKILPRYVLIENVPGIQWLRKGEVLEKIKQLLRKMEYTVKVAVLKAEEYGVPQKRRRVFILGHQRGEKAQFPPEPMFAEIDRLRFCTKGPNLLPRSPTVEDAISDLPPLRHGGGSEVTTYDDSWTDSDYQHWSRGYLTFEEYYERLKDPLEISIR